MDAKTTTVPGQLFRLEQLDTDLEQRTASLADMQARQRANPELAAAQMRLATLQKQEAEAAARQRSLEADLATLETRITRDHNRMYSGQIVDSRELGSLERELEHLRGQRGGVEERLLETMEQAEDLQRRVAESTSAVEALRTRWQGDQPGLARSIEQTGSELEELRAAREQLAAELDARSLDLYRRLRKSSSHAISAVNNGVCQWCRVNIPPKDIQHARAGALVTCTNCARILY